MVGKKGQATLFIILGIVLVVIVVLLFYTRTVELPRRYVESSQVSPVEAYVEDCVEEVVEEDVKERMRWAGYDYERANSVLSPDFVKFNLVYDEINHVLIKTSIQNDISSDIDEYLRNKCDLNRFGNVDYSRLSVSSMLNNDNIIVNIDLPIIISRGEDSVEKKKFNFVIETNLGRFWDIMNDIVESWANPLNSKYKSVSPPYVVFDVVEYYNKNPEVVNNDFEILGPVNDQDDDLGEITKFYHIKKYDDEKVMLFALRVEI